MVPEHDQPVLSERIKLKWGSILLVLLPLLSFLTQLEFSKRSGTLSLMLHHPLVTVVDWIFVPFNYFACKCIEWKYGGTFFIIMGCSVVLNILTMAYWQEYHLDPGHMISVTGNILPAGWVHLFFSIIETSLLAAFVFCRKLSHPSFVATICGTCYFVLLIVCGYRIHNGFIASDVIVFILGIFFLLVYPKLFLKSEMPADS